MNCNKYKIYPFTLELCNIVSSPFSISNKFRIIYVISGVLSFHIGGKSFKLQSDEVEILNINEPSKLIAKGQNCKIAILTLSQDFVIDYPVDISSIIYNCKSNEFYDSGASTDNYNTLIKIVKSIIHEILQLNYSDFNLKNHNFSKEFDIHSSMPQHGIDLLNMITSDFDDVKNLLNNTDSSIRSERFYRIIRYIRTNLSANISLDNLIQSEFITKTYLSKEFSKYLNKTFKEVQSYYRVMLAIRLLIQTDYSIEEISATSGFSSSRYFYKYFKKQLDCTPNKFRIDNKNLPFISSKFLDIEIIELMNLLSNKNNDNLDDNSYSNILSQNRITRSENVFIRISYYDLLHMKKQDYNSMLFYNQLSNPKYSNINFSIVIVIYIDTIFDTGSYSEPIDISQIDSYDKEVKEIVDNINAFALNNSIYDIRVNIYTERNINIVTIDLFNLFIKNSENLKFNLVVNYDNSKN